MSDSRDPDHDELEFRRIIASLDPRRPIRWGSLLVPLVGLVGSLLLMMASLSVSPLVSFLFVVPAAWCADRLLRVLGDQVQKRR